MAAAPRSEFRGPGWALSLQRQRATAAPGRSSNLGAAALAVIERRGPKVRLAARVARGEGLWLSVIAPPEVAVAARLRDGRALAGDRLDDPPGPSAIHRFADAPLPGGDDPDAESLIVEIGACLLSIACLRAEAFDRLFGAPIETEGEPAVYEGWRLP
jgi:hypothetical protein